MPDPSPSPAPSQVAGFVEHASRAIGLPIRAEDLPGVLANTARLHALARLVMDFPLTDEVETAGVFEP